MEPMLLSKVCIALGLVSIFISLMLWSKSKGKPTEDKARGERFALFVGLWAPSMFTLAAYFGVVARL